MDIGISHDLSLNTVVADVVWVIFFAKPFEFSFFAIGAAQLHHSLAVFNEAGDFDINIVFSQRKIELNRILRGCYVFKVLWRTFENSCHDRSLLFDRKRLEHVISLQAVHHPCDIGLQRFAIVRQENEHGPAIIWISRTTDQAALFQLV